ncbi:MAG TPA: polysaccharide pyruvyl transferase family protein [Pseudoalteromonas sp.]|uniref:Polysaccharide pyruvyl transferase domain-containing protein n=1 Tax=marine sediment metagenome TaxID=412755 RepID=A0A0F9TWK5_9ZZZZ|nr:MULTISPECIES: polysaccharide pyruvyl transferase family protein [unclassified Pseudoalteromonas]MDN3389587.1 polysaccharide pyruvyl transferase family protein [Pseudoalteromonas sp. APC 3691]HDZ33312.1 polysaccharide pyruvyl transferase family protein [Pseudoalteromonas sp.]
MHYVVCGSDPGTSNLGVSALGNSAVEGLYKDNKTNKFTILDSLKGLRTLNYSVSSGFVNVTLCGAKLSKKFYQKESYINLKFNCFFNGYFNNNCKHLLSADVFLDVSGGDSFTDLYGKFRFNLVNAPKYFALKNNIPLVLLPQTYGPFISESTKNEARNIVINSKMAWARDLRSYEVLKQLLGDNFDPNRHRVGVDMAFALPVKRSDNKVNQKVLNWLNEGSINKVIGLNISGLIYNNPEEAKNRYKFKTEYNICIEQLLTYILDKTDYKVVLIPHVLTSPLGDYESDFKANKQLIAKLGLENSKRIEMQDANLDQCEVKWLISQMTWFMGTRMHATIAALSTRTPVCTISYSDKALGVFESCGVGYSVIDPRKLNTEQVLSEVINSLSNKSKLQFDLDACVPKVCIDAKNQLQEIDRYLRN